MRAPAPVAGTVKERVTAGEESRAVREVAAAAVPEAAERRGAAVARGVPVLRGAGEQVEARVPGPAEVEDPVVLEPDRGEVEDPVARE